MEARIAHHVRILIARRFGEVWTEFEEFLPPEIGVTCGGAVIDIEGLQFEVQLAATEVASTLILVAPPGFRSPNLRNRDDLTDAVAAWLRAGRPAPPAPISVSSPQPRGENRDDSARRVAQTVPDSGIPNLDSIAAVPDHALDGPTPGGSVFVAPQGPPRPPGRRGRRGPNPIVKTSGQVTPQELR